MLLPLMSFLGVYGGYGGELDIFLNHRRSEPRSQAGHDAQELLTGRNSVGATYLREN
jgi:hypothetical protein